MTLYKIRTRTRYPLNSKSDREFAAKKLPEHPITRYRKGKIWTEKYLATRNAKHSPTPINAREQAHCCLTCEKLGTKPGDLPNRPIWEKKFNARWLRGQYFWDFGFTLDPGLYYDNGVGRSPDIEGFLAPKNYLFAYDSSHHRPLSTLAGETYTLLDGNLSCPMHRNSKAEDIHFCRLNLTELGSTGITGRDSGRRFKNQLCAAVNYYPGVSGPDRLFDLFLDRYDNIFDTIQISVQSPTIYDTRTDILKTDGNLTRLTYDGGISVVASDGNKITFKK